MKKRLFTLALCACLVLSAGCSTTQAQINQYNAVLYVQGVLDETYTGAAGQGYLQLADITDEDVQKTYQKNLKAEFSQRVAVRFQLEENYLKNDMKQDFMELLETVCSKISYTVGQATALDHGRYCVAVSVTPVTFFQAAYADGYAKLRADYEKTYSLPDEEAQEDMTAAQIRRAKERFEQRWAKKVYDHLYARLDAITTGSAVTKLVLVAPDGNNNYSISATDLQDIDDLVLQY